jgi:methylase of polypeptide subunit release factors
LNKADHESFFCLFFREEELQENDDELQHLRISLKAVEVQLPPNPDSDLLRCIAIFKDDYRALKEKRASLRSSPGGVVDAGTGTGSTPARMYCP